MEVSKTWLSLRNFIKFLKRRPVFGTGLPRALLCFNTKVRWGRGGGFYRPPPGRFAAANLPAPLWYPQRHRVTGAPFALTREPASPWFGRIAGLWLCSFAVKLQILQRPVAALQLRLMLRRTGLPSGGLFCYAKLTKGKVVLRVWLQAVSFVRLFAQNAKSLEPAGKNRRKISSQSGYSKQKPPKNQKLLMQRGFVRFAQPG